MTTPHPESQPDGFAVSPMSDAPAGPRHLLTVTDIEAARRELTARGVTVSDSRHKSPIDDWRGEWAAGLADFADPDGNTWVIQEIGFGGPR